MASSVAKTKKSEVTEFDPSMFEADAGDGVSNMGQEDLALPFLKILSGLDPLLDELDEAKRGDLYNTVSSCADFKTTVEIPLGDVLGSFLLSASPLLEFLPLGSHECILSPVDPGF